ncbi:tyrocidine synthase 3 [Duganella sp. HH105]|nr:non-ribosomal peptide synthetase [Duganella sp. HH105]OEZ60290.1 tyrocidine synthase 3 [Duganella sp. HH105]
MTSARNLAYVIYTSGSTGRPKGAAIDHAGIVNRLRWMQQAYELTPQDRVLQKTPFSFDVSVWEFFWPLMEGARLVLAKPGGHQDVAYLSQLIAQQGITTAHFVPPMLEVFANAAPVEQGATLRQVMCSGQALPWELQQRFLGQWRHVALHNLYGPTEASVDVTYWRCDAESELSCVPIGHPIANTQIHILDAGLNPVPMGVAGELHIAGVGLARGYVKRADLTADKFVPNPFGEAGSRMYKSGDLARYLEDGSIEYLGRIDHQVKLRGFRIELGEIESTLAALDPVRDALVLAREDVAGDQRLVAYLVAHDGEQLPDAAGLRAALLASLPEYMVPAHFMVLDQLPLTPNGKVDRKALPAPDMARSEEGYVAPRTAAEEAMADIWAGVLNLDKVGVHDNFFTLGGHSLLAITLVERMRRAGLNVDVRTLFATPTIAALAGASGGENNDIVVPANGIVAGSTAITPEMVTLVKLDEQEIARVVAAVPGGAANIQDIYPLAPLQEGILFHHMMNQEGDAYLLPHMMQFDSRERLDGFVSALNKVVARHDILRTAMHWEGMSEAVQVVWREAHLVGEQINLDDVADVAAELAARYHPSHFRLDVRQAPLMRAFVAQDKARDRWLLQILAHHLAIDHSTLEMLVEEVRMLLQGRADELPPALPFRNFVAQARLGVSQAEHEAYFGAMLADVDEPTAPFGLLDVQGDGTGIVESRRMIDSDLSRRLRRQARQLGVSAASVMHLAWAQVLSKVSGRDDVVFGTVLLGRMAGGEDASSVLGMFINTLPVRFKLGEQGVAQAVRSAHGMLTQLLRHEHASLALAQRCSGVEAPMPLFSALLNYRHSVAPQAKSGANADNAWQGVGVISSEERTNYPVMLSVDDLGEDFALTAQVVTAVPAQRICDYMHAILEQLVEALESTPDSAVGTLDVLPAAERLQLLLEWNDTARDYRSVSMMPALFEERAAASPDRVALVHEGEQLTYGELNARANRLAHHLRTLGVGPDVLVGLCVERSLEMMVGLLAILKAGGAYVPLDPAYPADRLAYMLEDAAPVVLLTQQRLLASVPTGGLPVFCLDADAASLAGYDATNPSELTTGGNLAYVIYTSGSTGKPKGVALNRANLANFLHSMDEAPGMSSDDVLVAVTSLSFDIAALELFLPLANGARVVLAGRQTASNPQQLSELLVRSGATMMQATPSSWRMLVDHGWPQELQLKVLCGGEALPVGLMRDVLGHVDAIWNLYGPTETTIWSTLRRVSALDGAPVIGKPIANTQVYILDAGLNPVPAGVAGELHIAGEGLARGYLHRGDLTADKFIPNPFGAAGSRMYKSGDLARYLQDGSIEYLGRIDNQVKLRGFRIELGEIESALAGLAAVRDALVLAREDVAGDKRLVAYLVAHEDAQLPDTEGLRAALLESLPEYMVPAHFMVLEQLPLTPNGKVDRKALPVPDMTRSEGGYVAPRTAAEESMAAVWAGVLNLDKVGIHDNFFALGGHSLLAITLVERMRRAGLNVDVRTLFATPTIAALAGASGAANNDVVVPPNGIVAGCTAITPEMLTLVELDEEEIARVVAAVPGGAANIQDIYPLAPLQEGILFHHMMNEEGDAYLLPNLMQFDSRERLDGFVSALNMVIARHDILRTALHWEGLNEAVQVVWREAHLVAEQVNLDDAADVAAELAARYHPRHYRLDVRQAPLLRTFVAQDKAQGRWLLQILAHHLAIDHSTLELLIAEVRMLLQGRAEELAPALPFRNFVAQARLGVSKAEHEAYFSAMLADVDEPTAPFGLLDVQGDGTGVLQSQQLLDNGLARRLRQQARQLGVSVASVMHLAWAQVLARVSGRDDVVFGTVLLGRMAGGEDAASVLGMFINTLPVRFKLDEQGVAHSVRAAHGVLTQLLRHEHASLALAQRCSGVKAPMPLFSALLNYRHSMAPEGGAAGADAAWQGVGMLRSEERSNYPFTMSIDDLGEDFALTAQVDAAVPAQRVCGYMHTALERLVVALENAPDTAVRTLDVMPDAEHHRIMVEWNDTARDYPATSTLEQLFDEQAACLPDQIALVGSGRRMTYAQLHAESRSLGAALHGLGAQPNRLIAIVMDKGWEQVVASLGIIYAGAAYLPIDPDMPRERMRHILQQAEVSIVVTQPSVKQRMDWPEFIVSCIVVEPSSGVPASVDLTAVERSPDHLAYVIYTSGSTGMPKGVVIDHRGAVNTVHDINRRFTVTPEDKVLALSSLSFDLSVYDIFGTLAAGATIVMPDHELSRDPAHWYALVKEHGVTIWNSVPTLLTMLVDHADDAGGLPACLRQAMLSGDWLPLSLPVRFKAMLPQARISSLGGATEASIWSISYPIEQVDSHWRSVPYGRPMDNQRFYVLDRHFRPAPAGVAGDLYIGGIGLALGYWRDEQRTNASFMHHPHSGERLYKTGDLGRYLADGNIEFLGRIDNQVKIRGFRIELGEIEAALAQLEVVRESVVVVREDTPGDRRIVAYVRLHDEMEVPPVETLRYALAQVLPDYMVPSHCIVLDELPLSSNGKVDRKALPAPAAQQGAASGAAPGTPTEQLLAALYAQVLGLEQVGVHDDFFRLGGHSLLVMQLMAGVRRTFGITLGLRVFYEAASVHALACQIDALLELNRKSDLYGTSALEEIEY